MNEETKQQWIKISVIALITFIVAYLAFFAALKHHLKRISNPFYQVERMGKDIAKEQKSLDRINDEYFINPFEPKMRPMFVNLIKEPSEYKVIIDLTALDGNENTIDVKIDGNELTITGDMDKKIRGSEKIINFTQTYYLDEPINDTKIEKIKRGDKYIITIPFKTNENLDSD